MDGRVTRLLLASTVLIAAAGLRSQGALGKEVERYLAEANEEEASRLLQQILSSKPAPAELLAAVRAVPPAPEDGVVQGTFPFEGELLRFRAELPERSSDEERRPPAILDIPGGHNFQVLGMRGCVRVSVERFDSQEFTDRRRDGYLKGLRVAAHQAGADPDRLWMDGYSWSAHASWDIAQHRPGVLRGIAAFGGGPRRVYFRLMRNLQGMDLRSYCGAHDDPELVWNLKEMQLVSKREKLDYHLILDPEQGHNMPLLGYRDLEGIVQKDAPEAWPAEGKRRGEWLADGPRVESPLLRFDEVAESRVKVPTRIPVSARLDHDGRRRATIQAMAKKVASLKWIWEREGQTVKLTLRPKYVRKLTVFLREPFCSVGDQVTVKVGRRVRFRGELEPDPEALLQEARRTGERIRPALRRIPADL